MVMIFFHLYNQILKVHTSVFTLDRWQQDIKPSFPDPCELNDKLIARNKSFYFRPLTLC